jgi:putative SOS response-associated peptidase YedK
MCSHYQAIANRERFARHFGADLPEDAGALDVWPGYRAVFLRNTAPERAAAPAQRQALTGVFGLIPPWSTDLRMARRTYNARSETAFEKPSFRDAWRRAQHCIVPAALLFEPDWRSGRAVAAGIGLAQEEPLGVAGLWSCWRSPEGAPVQEIYSFTMLTVNADGSALMRQMHKPEDEKRMVVVLDPAHYADWLGLPARHSLDFLHSHAQQALVQHSP